MDTPTIASATAARRRIRRRRTAATNMPSKPTARLPMAPRERVANVVAASRAALAQATS